MSVPFTQEQFLYNIATYNLSVYPMQFVMYLLAGLALFMLFRKQAYSDRLISAILAFFWIWMGIMYHIMNFASINTTAYVFGVIFILQGMLFIRYGIIGKKLTFRFLPDRYGAIAILLLTYSLVFYHLFGNFIGHVYPAIPTFGLPCPTTIFTFGMLLLAPKVPQSLIIIPLLWAFIGGSAAFMFGILQDTLLLLMGLVATVMILYRNHLDGK